MRELPREAYDIIEGRNSDPFHYLGLHKEGNRPVVRVFLPDASEVIAVTAQGKASSLRRIHDAGLFAGPMSDATRDYKLRARFGNDVVDLEDPYRFPPIL